MAKKEQKQKSIEEALWESANKLRGSVEPSEYKHVVLSLIFLKYTSDRFLERRNELIGEGKRHLLTSRYSTMRKTSSTSTSRAVGTI